MKALFLFNGQRDAEARAVEAGAGHDNHFLGMYRVRRYGIESEFREPERSLPKGLARWWRRTAGLHFAHFIYLPILSRYDLVFSNGAFGLFFVKTLLRLKRPKWVINDANVMGTLGDGKTLKQKAFAFAVSRADGIVTLSLAEKEALEKRFPHLAGRIEFIYKGVDLERFKPQDVVEEEYLLSVGLDPGRDFKTAIEAVRDTKYELRIATKPERVEKYGPLPENVSVKRYPMEEMAALYARAKLVVVTLAVKSEESTDSMGTYAVIEAMASGKPVIVTRSAALAPYVTDGVTGVFVPPRDPDALRTAIEELWNDDAKRRAEGKAAYEHAQAHFGAEEYGRAIAAFFYRVTGQEAPPSLRRGTAGSATEGDVLG